MRRQNHIDPNAGSHRSSVKSMRRQNHIDPNASLRPEFGKIDVQTEPHRSKRKPLARVRQNRCADRTASPQKQASGRSLAKSIRRQKPIKPDVDSSQGLAKSMQNNALAQPRESGMNAPAHSRKQTIGRHFIQVRNCSSEIFASDCLGTRPPTLFRCIFGAQASIGSALKGHPSAARIMNASALEHSRASRDRPAVLATPGLWSAIRKSGYRFSVKIARPTKNRARPANCGASTRSDPALSRSHVGKWADDLLRVFVCASILSNSGKSLRLDRCGCFHIILRG